MKPLDMLKVLKWLDETLLLHVSLGLSDVLGMEVIPLPDRRCAFIELQVMGTARLLVGDPNSNWGDDTW
jgi:hypothetical protein